MAAAALLDSLYQAVLTRTDAVIDGIPVPAAVLTTSSDTHRELVQWLWGVQLADGSRALTTAGRWRDAEDRLRRHNGIGRRMLDGRQVAVLARAISGDRAEALHLLAETQPGEPWEAAVAACLTALVLPTDLALLVDNVEMMVTRYRSLRPEPTLAVFRTRLGLAIIDAINKPDDPMTRNIARDLIREVLDYGDGYAARDVLSHHSSVAVGTSDQAHGLSTVVEASGLGRPLPELAIHRLETALATSKAVIVNSLSATAA
ncbi:hypothetical protein [Micromonospora sp. CPCC 206061]|uniref:hypothetical protein n=1 Tax=Micromonospora sp. CPCC 206061 TaxID=3122410 RepID=UPI002FF32C0C